MKALRALTALLLTGLAVSVPLASGNHGAPQLVTPNTPTAQFTATISLDGSRVFFDTPDALSGDDGDTAIDVYQRVLSTQAVTLVSDRVTGTDAALDAANAGFSADGSHVFFRTKERIFDEDDDDSQDVYERFAGTTTLVTDPPEPTVGQELDANAAAISRDGLSYFFTTNEALLPADTDSVQDLYLRKGGTTRLISDRVQDAADAASPAGANGGAAGLSDDGSRILFSTSEQIVDADDDTFSDLYLHDVTSSTTTLVSDRRQDTNDEAKTIAFTARMTPDGSRIYFSTTEALLADDTDGTAEDVYQYTLATGVTTMISDHPTPGADAAKGAILSASGGMNRPATADGSRVVFLTQESLVADDTDGALCAGGVGCLDTYVRVNGATYEILSDDPDLAEPDEGSQSSPQAVSPDGARVIFTHFESLDAQDTDSVQDVYLREGGVTTLLTDSQIPGHVDSGATISGALANKDVTRVFFRPTEPLVAADTDSSQDVYERAAGVTTLLSDRQQPGADAEKTINAQSHSEDGSQVVFTTEEPLVAEDGDAFYDAYWSSGGPLPTEPTPTPTDPTPTDPTPTDPTPTDPTPTDPKPNPESPDPPGITPPGPLSACTPAVGFRKTTIKPARRGLSFKLALSQKRAFVAEVFQRSQGRNLLNKRVARFKRKAGAASHAFKWNGRSARSDGLYAVRLTMVLANRRRDVRQFVFERRKGKLAPRPSHQRRDSCDPLRAFKLSGPAFGGTKKKALKISYLLGGASDVEVSVKRGAAIVLARPKLRQPGGQTLTVSLPVAKLKRGVYAVTVRVIRGAQVTTATLTARLL
jgi:hypothetical protein